MKTPMTTDRLRELYAEADARMKKHKGHQYETILKTRCIGCGRSPAAAEKSKSPCHNWFGSFLDHLTDVLVEEGVAVRETATLS